MEEECCELAIAENSSVDLPGTLRAYGDLPFFDSYISTSLRSFTSLGIVRFGSVLISEYEEMLTEYLRGQMVVVLGVEEFHLG